MLALNPESEDCAKHVCVKAGLTVSDSDRHLGGHPRRFRLAKDLQDEPLIVASGNGPKQD